ncbi:MAG TPA: beta-L-arabinofuranosidase domain-containing protein [Actinocrinis sp.]|nr:beta-L-arabinofuranosidase domain-containing protein [Actinocrinis sp.]
MGRTELRLEAGRPSVSVRARVGRTQPGAAHGPVRPGPDSAAALAPAPGSEITGGFWAQRRRVIGQDCVPQGPDLLESAGNLHNLRLAAGTQTGGYRGDLPFLDSDVYKWLEAAGWQAAAPGGLSARLQEQVDRIIGLVGAAQQVDGYVNSWFQTARKGSRYTDFRWGHELYCAGHLIQAAVAHHRCTGRPELLDIAVRFADHLDAVFGPGRPIDAVDGHPEIETALVELYRETGKRRYLELAGYFLDRRGHGLLAKPPGGHGPGAAYFQDHVPVREADAVAGHAVRQLYLLAGVADVATETGDPRLREAAERLWAEMTTCKTHLTGGLGAHHEWEDFGDPFELPNEHAYCETCAAIASVQWSWRMALLTGEAKYSDLIERTLYNAVLPGVSLDGSRWLYVNPLQVRDGYRAPDGDQGARRTGWFRCACCPPNVMRLLASLPHYFASSCDTGLQIHQYADGHYDGATAAGDVSVRVATGYPWTGRVSVVVEQSPDAAPWTLSLRLPHWCADHKLTVAGGPADLEPEDGWLRVRRAWKAGDAVELDLDLAPRLTAADRRVDAVRGCVALERGPLVYCVEEVDNPGDGLDGLLLDAGAQLSDEYVPGLLGGVTVVRGTAVGRPVEPSGDWWPYRRAQAPADGPPGGADGRRELVAIPYYAWANRRDGAMRIWLPTA